MADSLTQAGFEAFLELCAEMYKISEETASRLESGGLAFGPDTTDYVRIVGALQEGLRRHVEQAQPQHAMGFLRALADMICANVEGGGVPFGYGWDPIATTELSFSGGLDRLLSGAQKEGAAHG